MIGGIVIALATIFGMRLLLSKIVTEPLSKLGSVMTELADGKTDLIIHDLDRKDEIGRMAQSVDVFRTNAIAKKTHGSRTGSGIAQAQRTHEDA